MPIISVLFASAILIVGFQLYKGGMDVFQSQLSESIRNNASALLKQKQYNLFATGSSLSLLLRNTSPEEADLALTQHLEAHWDSMMLEWGLESIVLYNIDSQQALTWGDPHDLSNSGLQLGIIEEETTQDICDEYCSIYAKIPIISGSNVKKQLVVGSGLIDFILEFAVENELKAALIQPIKEISSVNTDLPHSRKSADTSANTNSTTITAKNTIAPWKMTIAGMTNRETYASIINDVAQYNTLTEMIQAGKSVTDLTGQTYYVFALPLAPNTVGSDYILLAKDISQEMKNVNDSMRQGGFIALAGLASSIIFILYILNDPMRRIQRQAQLLPLLAKKEFVHVRGQINMHRKHHAFSNELDILEKIAIELSQELEELYGEIEQRTEALSQRNHDIGALLDHIQQGLLTITPDKTVHPEFSKHLASLLDTEKIAGESFISLLFNNADLSADAIEQIRCAAEAIIGEPEMMFDFNSHLLIQEYTRTLPSGTTQHLKLDWVPIRGPEHIEKLMLTVQDVTEEYTLREQNAKQAEELEKLGRLTSAGRKQVMQFLEDAQARIEAANKDNDFSPHGSAWQKWNASLHTIKGAARTLRLPDLTDQAHHFEVGLKALQNQSQSHENAANKTNKNTHITETNNYSDAKNHVTTHLLQLLRMINDYQKLAREKLNWTSDSDRDVWVEDLLHPIFENLYITAEQLNLPVPKLCCQFEPLKLPTKTARVLSEALLHIATNALTHGIEPAAQRLIQGKSERGQITITLIPPNQGDTVQTPKVQDLGIITIQDDGRGLNLAKLWHRYRTTKQTDESKPSDEIIASLIWDSGLSTKDSISQLSGQGLGSFCCKTQPGGNWGIRQCHTRIPPEQ